jgi:hypothetical protein
MTLFTIIFLLINAIALLSLPRHLAPLPLLLGCCYMTVGQRFDIGPISFNVIRVLVLAGMMRVMMRGERLTGGLNGMDKLMIGWMVWIALSSFIHPGGQLPLVFNLGQAYNIGGIYFLIRIFCGDIEELVEVVKLTAWLLAPIAAEMLMEQITGKNMFSVFGSVAAEVNIRNDRFRAQGPFSHAILAGSVGAACFPLMVGIWQKHRRESLIGMVSCVVIVVASASSGPLMSLLFGIGAIILWKRRNLVPMMRWLGVGAYIGLELVMNKPAYYIISKIDLTGGSTGWHRARLIESAIERLGEWWLAGTNFTRHWMASGVSWSPNHTDITNYYILMGVWAGLPLMFLFIAMIWTGFRYVGRVIRDNEEMEASSRFMVWCVGAALFSHTATCVSVAYFDQSYIFMFLCLAAASSFHSIKVVERYSEEPAPDMNAVPRGFDPPLPPLPPRA